MKLLSTTLLSAALLAFTSASDAKNLRTRSLQGSVTEIEVDPFGNEAVPCINTKNAKKNNNFLTLRIVTSSRAYAEDVIQLSKQFET